MAKIAPRDLIDRVRAIVGADHCIVDPAELRTYECDALASLRFPPELVALPKTTEEVVLLMKLAGENGIPVVPRGAGTGLSGGALPVEGCIVIGTSRMKRILELDFANGFARVEPGVINLDVSRAVDAAGSTTLPTRHRRACAPSGATSPRTRVARIASNTDLRPTMSSGYASFCRREK